MSIVIGISAWLVTSVFAHSATPMGTQSEPVPKACYFFSPELASYATDSKLESAKVRVYLASISEVYRQWCAGKQETELGAQERAAEAMVTAWKLAWDERQPYDVEFHERGAFDLLVLLGITHHLPKRMMSDPRLIADWIHECSGTCFTLNGDLGDPHEQKYVLQQLRLRNDVLDHLRKESASEPVLEMLSKATFRLVD